MEEIDYKSEVQILMSPPTEYDRVAGFVCCEAAANATKCAIISETLLDVGKSFEIILTRRIHFAIFSKQLRLPRSRLLSATFRIMVKSVKLDSVNATDFTKGFQRFRITMPLESLEAKELATKDVNSSKFETKVVDGDRELTLSLYLSIGNCTNNPLRWFGMCLWNADSTILPMVCRSSLVSEKEGPCFDRRMVVVCDLDGCPGFTFTAAEVAAFKGINLTLHCWVDILIAVVGCFSDKIFTSAMSERRCLTFHEKALADLQSGYSDLFPTVLSGDSNGFSDVSLIVSKKRTKTESKGTESGSGQSQEPSKIENENRKFGCHRFVLAARSSVFNRMFAGGKWKESKGVVNIDDIDEKTMEDVLRYIYLGQFPDSKAVTIEEVSNFVHAADEYNLTVLKDWCVSLIIYKFSESDTLKTLELAELHGFEQLKTVCITVLSMGLIDFIEKVANGAAAGKDLVASVAKDAKLREYKTESIAVVSKE